MPASRLLAVLAIACSGIVAAQGDISTAHIDSGQVTSSTIGGVSAYLGIPYASPPVGSLRWRPPQRAVRWTGPLSANRFGTSCIQNQPGSRLPWTEEFMTQGAIGEDCLFANVWTAATTSSARLPVMFWIYGGAFTEGSSAIAVYNGAALARTGVIVVSANYRVGPLGFLAHPTLTRESEHGASGNYGLLDQIAALEWVQRNIAAFGGDPRRVTIFGQSAGAMSVSSLMRSPLAKGLFSRAIAQSGPGLFARNFLGNNATLAEREAAGARYAESKSATTLAALRALPASELVAPSSASGSPGLPSSPVVDGWVLTAVPPPGQVPLLAGFVADDLGLGGTTPDEKVALRERARVSMHLWAAEQVKFSRRMYTYYFDRAIPWPAHPEFGAFHSSEIPYVFGTLSRLNRPWEPVDRAIAESIAAYFTNFAKTGDPNGAGLPRWPAYDPARYTTMRIGERSGPMELAARDRVKVLVTELNR